MPQSTSGQAHLRLLAITIIRFKKIRYAGLAAARLQFGGFKKVRPLLKIACKHHFQFQANTTIFIPMALSGPLAKGKGTSISTNICVQKIVPVCTIIKSIKSCYHLFNKN
jgi:hypothetical protein